MKHVLLALLLLAACVGQGHAQAPADTTSAARSIGPASPREYEAPLTAFADSINRVFQYVDKTRIPSGILEEYGLQLIDHAPFTGTNGFTAANQLDIHRWRAIYADLYGAKINDNADLLASLSTVNLRLAQYARDANVELPILHLDYHSIRTDALSSGRIRSVRNRLYDVAGRDPYQRNTAFAVAASNGDLPSASTSFIFRSNQFWTNTGRTVATLQADFGDGNGFVGMSWNVAHLVSYAAAGVKDVKVRVGYTDGSTWESHLVVVSPAPAPQARYRLAPANVTGQITALKAYNGQTASATITVGYSGQDKPTPDAAVLDRPLIVVKGFDVSGIIPVRRSDYKDFIASIDDPNNNQGILSDGADLDGYDIVYVDFNNGTDYIQRNAYLLEEVIKWVNATKQPLPGQTVKEPNVMVAMSMGGLIAQYALCDMERDMKRAILELNPIVIPHQVRLLITHDSPHQGANIPLSVQMTIRHLAGTTIRAPFSDDIKLIDRFPMLGQARDALLSPAAQQMLRYQTGRLPTITVQGQEYAGLVYAAPTSLYDTFQQEYQALLGPARVPEGTPRVLGTAGVPAIPAYPCRVVASSNGSECGRGQPFGPFAELARVSFTDNASNFPILTGAGHIVTGTSVFGGLNALGLISGPAALVGVGVVAVVSIGLMGAYDLTTEYRLNALPDQQRQQIYSIFLQVNKRTRALGIFRVQFTLVDFQAYSLPSQLPLDSGSGGIISLASYAGAAVNSGAATAGSVPAGALKVSQFCFLPTYSALNIVPGNSAALRAQYSPGTNVGTPFANFRTAGRENESHIEYTALNSTWMLRELRATTATPAQVLSCAAFCAANAPTVHGPAALCGATPFYVSNIPGTTVTWLAPSALVSLVQQGNNVSVTPLVNYGIFTLTAVFTSECGQMAATKTNIRVAGGIVTLEATNTTVSVNNGFSVYPTGVGANPTSFDWNARYTRSNSTQAPQMLTIHYRTSPVSYFVNTPNYPGVIDFFGDGVDDCGTATTATISINVTDNSLGTAPVVSLYPNPANETVDVHVQHADSTQAITVKLYDAQGQPRAQQTDTAGDDTIQLNTDALPDGLYYMQIIQGQQVVDREQLRIEQ